MASLLIDAYKIQLIVNHMMLTITPFIPKGVANDWQKAVNCLERTIGSILGNPERDLRAIVICQDRPPLRIKDERYIFLQTKQPKPNREDYDAKLHDIGLKTAEAFETARDFSPDYVMVVDADDLISNTLVSYVYQRPNFDAFCLKVGYEWREGASTFTIRHRFNQYCGSSHVYRFEDRLFPVWLGKSTTKRVCDQSHSYVEGALDAERLQVHKIWECKAVYVTGHGNNLDLVGHRLTMKRRIKDLVFSPWRNKPITPELRTEFGLQSEQ